MSIVDAVRQVYELTRVREMCKIEEDGEGIIFGWQAEEEAFAYALFVLKPVNKHQIALLVKVLWGWVTSSDDYADEEERRRKWHEFQPLFNLHNTHCGTDSEAWIWTEEHNAAFRAIENDGGWKSSYELL